MRILGIYVGHDSSVALLNDGRVELSLELERFSRYRHDYGFRRDFLALCLKRAGIGIEDIDLVAMNGWNWDGTTDPTSFGCRPGTVIHPSPVPRTPKLSDTVRFTVKIAGRELPAIAVNHHLAHLACGYYTSPFSDAVVISVDGGGDEQHSAVMVVKDGKPVLNKALDVFNIGILWHWLCHRNFGFPADAPFLPSTGPGKIMALAAYGKREPAMAAALAGEIFTRFLLTGEHKDDLRDSRSQFTQDYARALQDFTHAFMKSLLDAIGEQPECRGIDDLCLVGGVALNCVATSDAFRTSRFSRMHVPPCPHDGGLALGMALLAHHAINGAPYAPGRFSAYTGPEYTKADRETVLDRLHGQGWTVTALGDPAAAIAELLAQGEVVALWRGRSEIGPRALGHRSLLSRPDLKGRRDFLNQRVKKREWYRPLAPIILEEHAPALIPDFIPGSAYMSTSATIAEPWAERLSECMHIDRSTRPQVLARAAEPWLHGMLSRFHGLTGIPAVLNTSFNLQEPIVETPEDAATTFETMPIGALVIEDCLVKKPA